MSTRNAESVTLKLRTAQRPCMCSDCRKTQLLSHTAQWGMRSLIIEFKSGFCSVSGMGTIIATSDEQLQFRISAGSSQL